jgi:ligand-binding SRPBCC domain-containing protein
MPSDSIFQRSVDIDAPADLMWRFHLDTRNAPLISPDAATFLAIEGDFPVSVGSVITLKVRQPPMPIAQTWRVRVGAMIENRLVTDVAEKSPFARWSHEHRFEPLGEGRTRMTDHVTYALPFGPLGRLVDRLFVRRQLAGMFAERHAKTKRLFEGPDRPTS